MTSPSGFSTMRVVPRVATTRTVWLVIASSRSVAGTERPSALLTIFDVTTTMSPGCSSARSRMIAAMSSPSTISGMPSTAQISIRTACITLSA